MMAGEDEHWWQGWKSLFVLIPAIVVSCLLYFLVVWATGGEEPYRTDCGKALDRWAEIKSRCLEYPTRFRVDRETLEIVVDHTIGSHPDEECRDVLLDMQYYCD